MRVNVTDNSAIFKRAKDRAVAAALAAIGEEASGNALEEVKNQDAVDTGRLRNSITYATKQHTEAKSFSWHEGKNGEAAGSGITAPRGTPEKDTADLYRDAMALDTKEIAGGATTATQIRAAYEPLNSKTDNFEYCIHDFLDRLLAIAGITDGCL